jgi:hypothetical protein
VLCLNADLQDLVAFVQPLDYSWLVLAE